MHFEALNWINQAQGNTSVLPVASELITHQINASNNIGDGANSANSENLSKNNF